MSSSKGLDNLEVWQRSIQFAKQIYKEILPCLPAEEKWALTNQLRRASQSISANIAEGYGRYYYQEGVRFCYIARGSLEETYSLLKLAFELGYISKEIHNKISKQSREIQRMLNGYIAFLKKSKRGENEPGSRTSIKEFSIDYQRDPLPDDPDS